jgi:hypothetical protein
MALRAGILLHGAAVIRVAAVALLVPALAWAQPAADTVYHVEMALTGSPVVSAFRNPRVPGAGNEPSLGYGFFVRGLWHPGRLLAVGLMTGYLSIAEDEIPVDDASLEEFPEPTARLSAIPLQIAISMQQGSLEVGMGVGPYLMMSRIDDGNGVVADGKRAEFGITLFGSYYFPIAGRAAIGPELRILYLGYRGILSLMPSLTLRADLLRY